MKNRFKLGIIFNVQPSWMGGVIYILNIVKTLNFLEDEDKPYIIIFYRRELKKFLSEVDYPYIQFVEWSFPGLIKGYVFSKLRRKNLFVDKILSHYNLDAIFPVQEQPVKVESTTHLISWLADFQYMYYPQFFTWFNRKSRIERVKMALKSTDRLVLSSNDAHNDLKKFYKLKDNLSIRIYHFVSIIDNYESFVGDCYDMKKYSLPEEYFMISNQFHRHKNHRLPLLAIAELKKKGITKNLVMTGKFPQNSESPYLSELKSIIEDNQLNDQIIMLGVIPRIDQLKIMKNAQAVIQPSLFEGWSTVIEDAKSLQVPVIASSLAVNMEQLGKSSCFFDPKNVEELVNILARYPNDRDMNKSIYPSYENRVNEAAYTLLSIFNK